MGLLQNGFRHNLVGKAYGATLLDGALATAQVSNFCQAATNRNQNIGQAISSKYASVPSGSQSPYCWILPQEGGGVKTFKRGAISTSGATVGEMGLPRTAQSELSFTGILALDGLLSGTSVAMLVTTAQAIVDGNGSISPNVTVTLSGSVSAEAGALGTASGGMLLDATVIAGLVVSAAAQASLLLDGSTNIGGALESTASASVSLSGLVEIIGTLSGSSNTQLSITASSVIEGAGVPTTTGTLTLSGAITTLADGIFTASTANTGDDTLTTDAIAAAVMNYVIDSGYSFQQVTRLMSAILAGKTEIIDLGGGLATVTFRNLSDNTDATVFEMEGSERISRIDDL